MLAKLARDTLNGLVVFVVPGQDAYSRAQGTPRAEAGAIEADAAGFLIESLDNFVPFPDQIVAPVASALATGLADVPLPLGDLPQLPLTQLIQLDDAVRRLLRNDSTIPLSVVVALLLNTLATRVNPLSTNGVFLSPFARLSFEEKAKAFALLEEGDAALISTIDDQLPQPLRGTASGVLEFIAGALLEFSAFGAFSEWSTFDKEKRWVTETPVGWKLAGYDPGGMNGWDDFKGYYQGREEVSSR
ncbi:hypothetical protein ACIRON_12385 [Nocardioides sp. NPDC101246]|uniref:hypothetical protein n=1 Tax=Nocardioides sp. NPDC101246 TaxID=3364336 RepID=UPI0037F1F218